MLMIDETESTSESDLSRGRLSKFVEKVRRTFEGIRYPDRNLNVGILLELMPTLYFNNTFPKNERIEALLGRLDTETGLSYKVLLAQFLEEELPFDKYSLSKSKRIHIQVRHNGKLAPFCNAAYEDGLISKIQIEVNLDHAALNFRPGNAEVDISAAIDIFMTYVEIQSRIEKDPTQFELTEEAILSRDKTLAQLRLN